MSPSKTSKLPSPTKAPATRVLLVQVDSVDRSELHHTLERGGFSVVSKSSIKDALKCMTVDDFAALICDLHLPAAGDGFTLINAMRHMNPEAVTMIMSDYPTLRESLSDLLPQADEILVTPIPLQDVVALLKNRIGVPKHRVLKVRESVATILERHSSGTIREWLKRVHLSQDLTSIRMSDVDRTGHLHALVNEVVERLRTLRLDEGKAKSSTAAIAHGQARKHQGYTAAMLVEESRILQVCLFKTLRSNLNAVDLALVLTDVMTIADEVDSQLTQTMASFSGHAVEARNRRYVSSA